MQSNNYNCDLHSFFFTFNGNPHESPMINLINLYLEERENYCAKSIGSLFCDLHRFFYLINNLLKNKRHNFIFIMNLKNPINEKISICPLNNIHILFKNNFRNLINQVPT